MVNCSLKISPSKVGMPDLEAMVSSNVFETMSLRDKTWKKSDGKARLKMVSRDSRKRKSASSHDQTRQ